MLKCLQQICKYEHLSLSRDEIDAIMLDAGGDLRNALQSLQLVACQSNAESSVAFAADSCAHVRKRSRAGGKRGVVMTGVGPPSTLTGRDRFADMFHTLGSILHKPSKRMKLLAERENQRSTALDAAQEHRDTQQQSTSDGSALSISSLDDSYCPERALEVILTLLSNAMLLSVSVACSI